MGRLVQPPRVDSPCTGVCRIDAGGNRCIGCARTLDEIAAWGSMTPAARAAVMEDLPHRRSAKHF